MNPKQLRDSIKSQCGFTPNKANEWRHPITGETREEMHAKRTKYTPQISANHCPNCGRKLSDCNGNCIFDKSQQGEPTSFSAWLEANNDSIEPLDRTESATQWFDEKENFEQKP